MSDPATDYADDWCVAHVEVRFDGKHSTAEDAAHFIAHGTPAELDALVEEIQERGRWARWTPEELITPAQAHEEYDWLFAADGEEQAEPTVEAVAEDPEEAKKRRRADIESLLKSNADHAARAERRHVTGHLSREQADTLLRYWRTERENLENELTELSVVAATANSL